MNTETAERILRPLRSVNDSRARQHLDPALGRQVKLLKAYQAARFRLTYADLLTSPRHQEATRFFLEELYGPGDFVERDQQFERIVPTLVRMFPKNVCGTVQQLAELHALSEELDELMARQLPPGPISTEHYARAWQNVGRPEARAQQIRLAVQIGNDLDAYTSNRWLRNSLRVMRAPAAAAGLGTLQKFLEAGFDAFARLQGAQEFLSTIATREKALSEALYRAQLHCDAQNPAPPSGGLTDGKTPDSWSTLLPGG